MHSRLWNPEAPESAAQQEKGGPLLTEAKCHSQTASLKGGTISGPRNLSTASLERLQAVLAPEGEGLGALSS